MFPQAFQDGFSSWVGYPVLYRRLSRNRRISARFKELRSTQFHTPGFFRGAQLSALRRLLQHAGSQVPYYRQLFRQAGFDPETVKDVGDLRKLPRLTKQLIREHLAELKADNVAYASLTPNFTGGSTGIAMKFFQDENDHVDGGACADFSDYLAGWLPGRPRARLWGAPRDLAEYASMRARFRCFLYNYHQFNAFELSDECLSLYHDRLQRIRPTILICYASAAYRLAQYLRQRNLKADYPLHGLVTSAELLQPHMREAIEGVFLGRVFDRYGCREVGMLASECEAHEGLHVPMLSTVLEVDAPNRDGEGDVLVTNLSNYGMPLIRYEIGDRAKCLVGLCPCRRGMQRIHSVAGRITDFFVSRDGNHIAGPSLTLLFYGVSSIVQYQFVQEDFDRYDLNVVPSNSWDLAEIDRLLARIRLYLGDGAEIVVRRVKSIPRTETGKFRFIISKVTRSALEPVPAVADEVTGLG